MVYFLSVLIVLIIISYFVVLYPTDKVNMVKRLVMNNMHQRIVAVFFSC